MLLHTYISIKKLTHTLSMRKKISKSGPNNDDYIIHYIANKKINLGSLQFTKAFEAFLSAEDNGNIKT